MIFFLKGVTLHVFGALLSTCFTTAKPGVDNALSLADIDAEGFIRSSSHSTTAQYDIIMYWKSRYRDVSEVYVTIKGSTGSLSERIHLQESDRRYIVNKYRAKANVYRIITKPVDSPSSVVVSTNNTGPVPEFDQILIIKDDSTVYDFSETSSSKRTSNNAMIIEATLLYEYPAVSIRFQNSGMCVNPRLSSLPAPVNSPLIISYNCGTLDSFFTITPENNLQHLASGLCFDGTEQPRNTGPTDTTDTGDSTDTTGNSNTGGGINPDKNGTTEEIGNSNDGDTTIAAHLQIRPSATLHDKIVGGLHGTTDRKALAHLSGRYESTSQFRRPGDRRIETGLDGSQGDGTFPGDHPGVGHAGNSILGHLKAPYVNNPHLGNDEGGHLDGNGKNIDSGAGDYIDGTITRNDGGHGGGGISSKSGYSNRINHHSLDYGDDHHGNIGIGGEIDSLANHQPPRFSSKLHDVLERKRHEHLHNGELVDNYFDRKSTIADDMDEPSDLRSLQKGRSYIAGTRLFLRERCSLQFRFSHEIKGEPVQKRSMAQSYLVENSTGNCVGYENQRVILMPCGDVPSPVVFRDKKGNTITPRTQKELQKYVAEPTTNTTTPSSTSNTTSFEPCGGSCPSTCYPSCSQSCCSTSQSTNYGQGTGECGNNCLSTCYPSCSQSCCSSSQGTSYGQSNQGTSYGQSSSQGMNYGQSNMNSLTQAGFPQTSQNGNVQSQMSCPSQCKTQNCQSMSACPQTCCQSNGGDGGGNYQSVGSQGMSSSYSQSQSSCPAGCKRSCHSSCPFTCC